MARACGLSKSRASVLAEVLHGTGLLEKRADPADQRVVRLYVTPRAEDAGRPRLFRDALSTLVADLDAAERTQLLAGLRKLRAGAERRGW